MSLAKLASVFAIAGAAALTSGCTVYPVVGRHGGIGVGVAPVVVAPVYVRPAPVYVRPEPVCYSRDRYTGRTYRVPCY